jgi:hypothetical protein
MKTKADDSINVLYDEPNVYQDNGGLTKREYFAAMAMQGACATGHSWETNIASFAVKMADALITELNSESHE